MTPQCHPKTAYQPMEQTAPKGLMEPIEPVEALMHLTWPQFTLRRYIKVMVEKGIVYGQGLTYSD